MASFLFAAQPSIGHLTPMLTIAKQMRAEGHTIVFVCSAPAKATNIITISGFRLLNVRPSISTLGFFLLPFTSGYVETFMAVKLFFSGLYHYARTLGQVLDELQPDAVVSDFAFPGACLAAESRDTPYIVIYHAGLCFKGTGIPPFGSGLPIGEAWGRKGKSYRFMSDFLERSMNRTLDRTRRRLGLQPMEKGGLISILSPWLTLVLTAEAIEMPRFPLPLTTFFIGPCFADQQNIRASDFPFDQLSKDKPKIYISLGTVFNKRPKIFSKIIKALADGRCQLIVSAGSAFAKLRSQRIPSNVLLFESVPQVEVLSHVDVVISHGGNNTVNETLAAGKPLLVMPVGGEQGDNASRVVYLGAGLRTNVDKSTPQEIIDKVNRLIEEPSLRQRTEEIAKALSLMQGPVTAARFIERIVKTRQPIVRPEGYPLTVTSKTVPPWKFSANWEKIV